MSLTVYISNDNVLELSGLQNQVDDSYLNSATVTVTLVTSIAGAEVSGETWPLTLSYVSASDGKYRATLADTLSLSAGNYTARISADAGAGLKGYWEIPVTAATRVS